MTTFSKGRAPSQRHAAMVAFSVYRFVAGIAAISGVVNLLALTAPLFMLQVYDRVLTSGSVPTLAGLAVLASGLYAFQAVLDIIRARILLRLGEHFDNRFSGKVHEAVVHLPLVRPMSGDGLQPLRDLDNIRGFFGSNGPVGLFDLPWMPLYLLICFAFHPWLGMTALAGAIVLIAITLLTNLMSEGPVRQAMEFNMARNAQMEAGRRNAEIVRALGLENRIKARWQKDNDAYLAANRWAGDIACGLGGISKALRIFASIGHSRGWSFPCHPPGGQPRGNDCGIDHDGSGVSAGRYGHRKLEGLS